MFTERDRDRQTDTERDRERHRDREAEREKQTEGDRKTDRQNNRQTDRQRKYKGHRTSVHIKTALLGLPLQFDVQVLHIFFLFSVGEKKS